VEKAGSSATTVLDTYTIGKSIKDIDERIENMNRRLMSLEERYYRQFTAMETALSNMNAQAAYLLQQFGGA
jgi:flagellar hook-associated protein 2